MAKTLSITELLEQRASLEAQLAERQIGPLTTALEQITAINAALGPLRDTRAELVPGSEAHIHTGNFIQCAEAVEVILTRELAGLQTQQAEPLVNPLTPAG